MSALLIYCYSQGVMSSRKIERATYDNLAVRYLTGDTHPDHDTICTFRRENQEAFTEAFTETFTKTFTKTFVRVLDLAREMGVVKVGTVSVDGTHIKANASKHKSVRYDRSGELEQQLKADIEELLQQAYNAQIVVDTGYVNADAIERVQNNGTEVYVATPRVVSLSVEISAREILDCVGGDMGSRVFLSDAPPNRRALQAACPHELD